MRYASPVGQNFLPSTVLKQEWTIPHITVIFQIYEFYRSLCRSWIFCNRDHFSLQGCILAFFSNFYKQKRYRHITSVQVLVANWLYDCVAIEESDVTCNHCKKCIVNVQYNWYHHSSLLLLKYQYFKYITQAGLNSFSPFCTHIWYRLHLPSSSMYGLLINYSKMFCQNS